MAVKLNKDAGTVDNNSLLASLSPATDVFAVTIRKEKNKAATLKKGTVLAVSKGAAGDGKMVIFGTAAAGDETLEANCILCDDVTVGTAADVDTIAYRAGHFARSRMIVKDGADIADAQADLRKNGIVLSDVI